MSKPSGTPRVTRQLGAVSTGYITMATTPWLLAYGSGGTMRVLDEIAAVSGGYRHKVRWRTASVSPDYPDAWTDSTNVRTANGINIEDFTPTTDRLWVQAGLAVSSSAGVGEALATLQAMVQDPAEIVASDTVQLEPDLNSTQTAYFPIGDPFELIGTTGIMFAFVISGVVGTPSFQPVIRYMDRTDTSNTWNAIGNAVSPTTDQRTNSGNIVLTPPANLYGQAGIKVTATGVATIHTLVAVKR